MSSVHLDTLGMIHDFRLIADIETIQVSVSHSFLCYISFLKVVLRAFAPLQSGLMTSALKEFFYYVLMLHPLVKQQD